MRVTSNILQRTFHIRSGGNCGSCFTVDIDGKRYLVTARHIANTVRYPGEVEIFHSGDWKPLFVNLVGHGAGDVDVSVLAPGSLFGAAHQLSTTTANMTLGEDVYFLGFPFGYYIDGRRLNAGFPIPLVKKAVVSLFDGEDGVILLDGHNNPGFSGGPVLRGATSDQIIGVVSGYRFQRQAVLDMKENQGPYTYDANTGIVFVYDSEQIKKIVLKNPIGIEVDES